ncbi:hypothetical protein [Lutibacter sp.]
MSTKLKLNWKAKGLNAGMYDTELYYLYQFSLLGNRGRFVIINENGILVPKLLSKDQSVKIELNSNSSNLEIISFTIKDTYGYKYLFNTTENIESILITASLSQNGESSISASRAQAVYNNISSWLLYKIRTSNSYSTVQESFTTSITTTDNITTTNTTPDFLSNPYNLNKLKLNCIISHFATNTQTKKPLKITFKDSTSIYFESSINHHETGGAVLQDLIIKNNLNQDIKRFILTYSETDKLWLDKIDEKNTGKMLNFN